LYLDKTREIERYDRAFNEIWSAALDEKSSQDLLRQASREIEQE
jgi:hypothetical protein